MNAWSFLIARNARQIQIGNDRNHVNKIKLIGLYRVRTHLVGTFFCLEENRSWSLQVMRREGRKSEKNMSMLWVYHIRERNS